MLLDGEGKPLESVNAMLRNITPELIRILREHAGNITQAKFADNAYLTASQITRYAKKDEAPQQNMARFAAGGRISSGKLWWLVGKLVQEHYREHSFEIAGQPAEVKEARAPYDEPYLSDRVEAVMRRDLRGLDPHSMMALNHDRELIRRQLADLEADHGRGKERIEHALDVHEEHYQAAVRRAQGPKRA